MYYKEFDWSSYKLRYHRTWTVFKGKDEKEFLSYVHDIHEDRGFLIIPPGSKEMVWAGYDTVQPKYHFIASGFYHGQLKKDEHCAVRRRMTRSFSVGMNPHNYEFKWFNRNMRSDYPDILKPVKVDVENALKNGGPMSNTLYLWKGSLYYLSTIVGLRNGKKFVVDPMFKSEIEDCLRGHGCTVKL
jgi:hypothetical protein